MPSEQEIAEVEQIVAQLVAWLKQHEALRLARYARPDQRPPARLTPEQLEETWRRERLRPR